MHTSATSHFSSTIAPLFLGNNYELKTETVGNKSQVVNGVS